MSSEPQKTEFATFVGHTVFVFTLVAVALASLIFVGRVLGFKVHPETPPLQPAQPTSFAVQPENKTALRTQLTKSRHQRADPSLSTERNPKPGFEQSTIDPAPASIASIQSSFAPHLGAHQNRNDVVDSGNGNRVSVTGDGNVVSVSGNGNTFSISGDGAVVTISGNGNTFSVSGDASVVTISGNANRLSVSGDGNAVSVSGNGNTLSIPGDGNRISMNGNGNGVSVPGDGKSISMTENGGRISGM